MIFMFALPSQLPFSEDNLWDEEISSHSRMIY